MRKQINWNVPAADYAHIVTLATLAVKYAKNSQVHYDQHTAIMDLTAAHANGTPLLLAEMVAAIGTDNESDVLHDLFGIRRHIDRSTGEMLSCFVPRYAQPEKVA